MIVLEMKNESAVKKMCGFTLIELIVSMGIVSMMAMAVYAVHISHLRAVGAEEERVEIQQDMRISIDFITRELRSAGYDRAESGKPGIVDARSNYIYFTSDTNSNKDINEAGEHVAFCIYNSGTTGRMLSYLTGSSNAVGSVGSTSGALPIGHTHTGLIHEPIAPIEDVEFYYSYYDTVSNSIQQTLEPTFAQRKELVSVAITILSRADTPDPRWTDTQVYVPASGTAFNGGNPYGDTTRRRMVTANVRFRNIGL